jgi:hypothetical protein
MTTDPAPAEPQGSPEQAEFVTRAELVEALRASHYYGLADRLEKAGK